MRSWPLTWKIRRRFAPLPGCCWHGRQRSVQQRTISAIRPETWESAEARHPATASASITRSMPAGQRRYEIGAGWSQIAKSSGETYVNLKIAAPEFGPNWLRCRLGQARTPGATDIVLWEPRDR